MLFISAEVLRKKVLAMGDECFPIQGSQLNDQNKYFGKEEVIELSEAITIIHNVLDEIASWGER